MLDGFGSQAKLKLSKLWKQTLLMVSHNSENLIAGYLNTMLTSKQNTLAEGMVQRRGNEEEGLHPTSLVAILLEQHICTRRTPNKCGNRDKLKTRNITKRTYQKCVWYKNLVVNKNPFTKTHHTGTSNFSH